MERTTLRVLFVTYDGPQVAYLESLFVPIFQALKDHGVQVDVLQFRWGGNDSEPRTACENAGIGYRSVKVWRWGGSIGPFLSMVLEGLRIRRAVAAFRSDVIMPRSLMPAVAVLSAGGPKLRPLLFDADGLAADELVDVAGKSSRGYVYRVLRDVEAQIVRLSSSVITRTRRSAEILHHRAGPPTDIGMFSVVANGRDEQVFRTFEADELRAVRRELDVGDDTPLIVYAGSMGPQYRISDMRALFEAVRRTRPDARFLVMTGAPERATEALGQDASIIVMRVPPDQVARYLAAADVGLAYRSPIFSMQGVAPIKLSEYLLCGLPVIGTSGIGETEPVAAAGMFFDEAAGSEAAAQWLIEEVLPKREEFRSRARSIGVEQFSLKRSVGDYLRALEIFRS